MRSKHQIQIGTQTREFQHLSIDKVFEWLGESNLRVIEISVSSYEKHWGNVLFLQDNIKKVTNLFDDYQIDKSNSALRYSANMLDPCFMDERCDILMEVIELASNLGLNYVSCNVGSIPGANYMSNLVSFERNFIPIINIFWIKRNLIFLTYFKCFING